MKKIAFFTTGLALLAFSCKYLENKKTYFEYFIKKEDKGIVRGINIGDNKEKVIEKEEQEPLEKTDDFLYYDYQVNENFAYTVLYVFDEYGLSQISMDSYLYNDLDNTKSKQLYIEIKQYLNNKFGLGEEFKKVKTIWNVEAKREYPNLKVILEQDTLSKESKKVTLSIERKVEINNNS